VMHAMRRRALGGALILALVAAPSVAWSQAESQAPPQDVGLQNEAGIGALAALSTLVYGPVKIVYATAGLLFGGIAWGLSGGDGDVLTAVVTPSVRGDYVVTPDHIRMERGLEFFGRDPAYRSIQQASTDRSAPAAVSSGPVERHAEARLVQEDY